MWSLKCITRDCTRWVLPNMVKHVGWQDTVGVRPAKSQRVRFLDVSGIEVFIDPSYVADGLEITPGVLSGKWELLSEDEAVEFWPCIVEAAELPHSEESVSPAGMDTPQFAGGSWQFTQGRSVCKFWRLARLLTFRMTRAMLGCGLRRDIVWYGCSTLWI